VTTAAIIGSLGVLPASAQTTDSFRACTRGALSNCAVVQLTSQLGIGPGGLNFFEIALGNLGSRTSPSLATSIYFLSFVTGLPGVAPGAEVDALATPGAVGGAMISDPSPWSIFETGDAIFLSALGNDGVGGCAGSVPIGGFGQMARTCGPGQFVSFGFFTPRAFDPASVVLSGLEAVGLSPGLPADSCNGLTPCVISPVTTTTPEPAPAVLALTGLLMIAGLERRRRRGKGGQSSVVGRRSSVV
jgi:MYXO-CTERM domain-containing protein